MMLTDLADVLRAGGLRVVEVPGWKTRTADGNRFGPVQGILCHWTATNPQAAGDYPTLNTILNGNGQTPGPLSHLGLGRDGTWYVIAAGVCWHAGSVDRVASDNYHAIAVEAEYHPAQGAWPEAQQRSYERGVAVLSRHYGVALDNVRGHYEAAIPYGRKDDPKTLPGGMAGFRQRVKALLDSNLVGEDDDIMTGVRDPLVTVDNITYSPAQVFHLMAAFVQAVAPGTHLDVEGNPVLGDIFGAALFTDNPRTKSERTVRLRDALQEMRVNAAMVPGLVAAVSALSSNPALTPAEIQRVMRDAFADAVTVTGELTIRPSSEGAKP
jgi:hypothetical protein